MRYDNLNADERSLLFSMLEIDPMVRPHAS